MKQDNTQSKKELTKHECIEVRDLNESAYIVRFTKNGMKFKAGQYITLGREADLDTREYSIYSGENDECLEVLVREVGEGCVSKKLRKAKVGEKLNVDGPFGFFTIPEEEVQNNKLVFIATGTGISPFHSFVKTYGEDLDYQILHGVSSMKDAFESDHYDADKYIVCSAKDSKAHHHGRVTDYLKKHDFTPETRFYLCGNCDMIYEAFDILAAKGFSTDHLHAEVYY